MPLCAFKNACCTNPEFDCSMCGKHSTPKFCMICLICCSKYITSAWSFVLCFMRGGSFGIGKTRHRLSVKRRFEEEDFLNARDDVRDHHPIGCRSFVSPSSRSDCAPRKRRAQRERPRKNKKENKKDARWRRVSWFRRRFGRQSSRNPRTTWRSSSRLEFGRKWWPIFCDAASRKEAKEKKFSVSSRGREKSLATSSITRITIT